MASRYFLNIGTDWGSTANWSDTSGGAGGFSVPTNADDVFFDANSGDCDLNANRVAKSIDFTGYANTINMTNDLTVSGNVTLAASMTISGAGTLIINAACSINTNGKVWPNALTTTGLFTLTLLSDVEVGGLFSSAGNNRTISGTFNIICNNGFSIQQPIFIGSGTTPKFVVKGGSIVCLNAVSDINIDLDGDITILDNSYHRNGSLIYISGTITTLGTYFASLTTINASGFSFNNFSIYSTGGASTITLSSNLTITGLFTIATNQNIQINGAYTVIAQGGMTATNTGNTITSAGNTATLELAGGTFTGNAGISGTRISLNTTINGNVAFVNVFNFSNSTLTYISGTVNIGTSTFFFSQNCNLNLKGETSQTATTTYSSGVNLYNIITNTNAVITLLSDLTVINLYTCGITTTMNGFTLNLNGSITPNSVASTHNGTNTLQFIGDQPTTWSGASINSNVIFNKTALLTLNFSQLWGLGGTGRTVTYLQGTIDTGLSNVLLGSATYNFGNVESHSTYNEYGITFWNIGFGDQVTATFNSDMRVANNMSVARNTLNGGRNIYVSNLTPTTNPLLHGTSGGTCKIIFYGTGTHYWNGFGYISNDIEINMTGTLYIGTVGLNSLASGTPKTFNYIKGNVIGLSNSILTFYGTGGIFRGRIDKINIKDIRFNVNFYTMSTEYFFCGSPTMPTTVSPTSNLSTFLTINLLKEGECLAKFVKLQNCVMTTTQRGRFKITTPSGNKGGNSGIVFNDQHCQGFAKNAPIIYKEPMFGKLTADPLIVR
jgi:hypothetical protein